MSFRDWIELESDPGLFTLLVHDFGVQDLEVEEVYDLSKRIDRLVYGFIFLFKWTEERKSRRKAIPTEENFILDEKIENDMFFAQQIIPNSCASHALLSVLLNRTDLELGPTLTQLRNSCKGLDSESKGYAIGNFWSIAIAHNNHGRAELRWQSSNLKNVTATSRSLEAFHYVSYIPLQGRLYELDGLKPHPIDHGPWSDEESWSDKARQVIQNRILLATGGEYSHDIRYNLLAVVPEKRKEYKMKMDIFSHNKKILIELFKELAMKESFVNDPSCADLFKYDIQDHPFRKRNEKKSETDSHSESCSSTLSGQESPSHPFSDSEDSSVGTYRVKSIMRDKMKAQVYVFGESSPEQLEEVLDKKIEKEKEQTHSVMDIDSASCSKTSEVTVPNISDGEEKLSDTNIKPGDVNVEDAVLEKVGVEIIADDADIESLLDQNNLQELSLEKLLKYGDHIKLSNLQKCMQELDELYKSCESSYREELEKLEQYKVDDCRRRHNYDPFVATFLTMLADQDLLEKLLQEQNGSSLKKVATTVVRGNMTIKKDGFKKKIKSKKNNIKRK